MSRFLTLSGLLDGSALAGSTQAFWVNYQALLKRKSRWEAGSGSAGSPQKLEIFPKKFFREHWDGQCGSPNYWPHTPNWPYQSYRLVPFAAQSSTIILSGIRPFVCKM
jgi:hypothetical protein